MAAQAGFSFNGASIANGIDILIFEFRFTDLK